MGRLWTPMAALVVAGWAVAGEKASEHPLYPFEVTLGGQKAVMQEGNMLFAVVEKPVKADAVLALADASSMLIVNAFSCKEDGTVLEAQTAAIIVAREVREVKLNATMDKKPLEPGTYLMNVVAHNKTSRVVFTVGEKGKVKMPDIGKIFRFLKEKK